MRMGERKVPLEVASLRVMALISTLMVTTYGVCEFPLVWRGEWFLDSIQSIIEINKTYLVTRGNCLSSKGDKYLLEDRNESCVRCLSIHAKHKNVLQFKETLCERYETLENVCALLTGDAPLNSLFRADKNAKPTDCPFKNLPLGFSYNRGNGECNNPMSMLDACAEDSDVIFRYQACPDIKGSESSIEVLTCLGFWKEGFLRYFIGKVLFVKTRKTEFRCFIYEKGLSGDKTTFYNLAQSGDQSCAGLVTPVDGANVMVLAPLPATKTKCRYPLWVTSTPHWRSLDGTTSYFFFRKNGTFKVVGDDIYPKSKSPKTEVRISCHSQVFLNTTTLIAISHLTKGCDTSYSCLGLFLRDTNVLEVLQSRVFLQSPEDVCSPEHFEPENAEFATLVPLVPTKSPCPYSGKYKIKAQKGTLYPASTTLDITFTKPVFDNHNYDFYTIPTERGTRTTQTSPRTLPHGYDSPFVITTYSPKPLPTTVNGSLTTTYPTSAILTSPLTSTILTSPPTTTIRTTPPPPPIFTTTTERVLNCNPGQYKSVEVGCSYSGETLEFIHNCNRQFNSMYFCHGNWMHKNVSYLIVSPVSRKSTDFKYYCFMWNPLMREIDKSKKQLPDFVQHYELQVSAATRNCHRTITPGISGELAMNLSIIEFCEKAIKSRPEKQKGSIVVPSLLFLLVVPPVAYAAR